MFRSLRSFLAAIAPSFVSFCLAIAVGFAMMVVAAPARAGSIDAYVLRYLKAKEPVELPRDEAGNRETFSPEALSRGKRLFEANCLNCHVGGATLPDPTVSLSLKDLQGAVPSRANIENLVAFMRQPMTYDGSSDTFWCREVPESWMSDTEVEEIAAFILRAAEVAPAWGTETFSD